LRGTWLPRNPPLLRGVKLIVKIFVSVYPFGREDASVKKLLEDTGWSIIYNDRNRKLHESEVAELAGQCDGIIAGTENIRKLIEQSASLKMISRVGIGLDNVPLEICRQKNIAVSYTPDAVTPAVVEMTVGLMISLSRKLCQADREIREGLWQRHYGKRIGKSVIGIIGFGRVGSAVAEYLLPFQPAEILVNDIRDRSDKIRDLQQKGLNIRAVEKSEIYLQANMITIHTPLTGQTRNMISSKEINTMKPDTVIINTARGGILNEDDLYEALKNNRLEGAAIDVFTKEPYQGNLNKLENVILTQHMGSCSYDCRKEMEMQAAEEMIRFFRTEKLLRLVPEEEFDFQRN